MKQMKYVCPVCQNEEHRDDAKFCMICGSKIDEEKFRVVESKRLDEVLVEYFGGGFPLPESPTCDSYEKLVKLLYDVGNLTGCSMEDVVETLDDISNENALRDCNGELIYEEEQIKEELILRGRWPAKAETMTPFGKLVANPTMDEEAPGICVCIVENGYERPLAVVEACEEDGAQSLRLVAWENSDFESYSECKRFFEQEDKDE